MYIPCVFVKHYEHNVFTPSFINSVGQHHSLKNEAERLRMICGRHRRSKSAASCFEIPPVDSSTISWQMLDFGNLSLGGSRASFKHNLG